MVFSVATALLTSVTRITFDHLVIRLEAGHGDFLNRVRFMGGLSGRDHGGVCDKGEMDARVWDEIGLKLGKVNIEGTIEP